MKRLNEGESKIFKRSEFGGLQVTAECIDCDTPYIHLKRGDKEMRITDAEAHYLLKILPKALSILPSSK